MRKKAENCFNWFPCYKSCKGCKDFISHKKVERLRKKYKN